MNIQFQDGLDGLEIMKWSGILYLDYLKILENKIQIYKS